MSSQTSLPIARIPSVIAATPEEQRMERLEFRGQSARPAGNPGPEVRSVDGGSVSIPSAMPAETDTRRESGLSDRLDEQLRAARVMNELFPAGVQINAAEQFATLRLFTALVANVAQFAQSGLRNPMPVRDVKRQAEALDEMAGSLGQR
jgi:hypothetical protein